MHIIYAYGQVVVIQYNIIKPTLFNSKIMSLSVDFNSNTGNFECGRRNACYTVGGQETVIIITSHGLIELPHFLEFLMQQKWIIMAMKSG